MDFLNIICSILRKPGVRKFATGHRASLPQTLLLSPAKPSWSCCCCYCCYYEMASNMILGPPSWDQIFAVFHHKLLYVIQNWDPTWQLQNSENFGDLQLLNIDFPIIADLYFYLQSLTAQKTCRHRTPSPWSRSWCPPGAFSNRPPQKSEIMNEVWQDDNWLKLKSNLKVIHHQVWNWRCGAHEELLERDRNC